MVVKLAEGVTTPAVDALEARAGIRITTRLSLPGVRVAAVDDGVARARALARLNADPAVKWAEPNHVYTTMTVPDDPSFPAQWSLPTIGAPSGWNVTTGGAPGVRIAIIDSGVDLTHPDLTPNLMGANPGETGSGRETNHQDDDGNGKVDDWRGWDFVNNDNTPQDDTPAGHGTHVAGIIAARGNNDLGVAGIAWRAQLISVKAIDAQGNGTEQEIAAAITYAAQRGARIANASFGGPNQSNLITSAIAHAPDTLFVVAAGNGGSDGAGDDNDKQPIFPCNLTLPNVVCVTATGRTDQLASFANTGPETVDLAAPGVDILSTTPGGGYTSDSGTSFAAPMVTGAAALVLAANPTFTTAQLREAIMGGVQPLSSLAGRVATGGRLSLPGALGIAPPPPPPPPPSSEGGTPPTPAPVIIPTVPRTLPRVKVATPARPRARIRARSRRWFISLRLGESSKASALLRRRKPAVGRRRARYVVVTGVRRKRYKAGIRRLSLGHLAAGRYRLRITVTGSRGRTILTRSFRVRAAPRRRGTASVATPARPRARIRARSRRWFISLRLGESSKASALLRRRKPAVGRRRARYVVVTGVRRKRYKAGIRRLSLGHLAAGRYRLRITVTGSRGRTILTRSFRVRAAPRRRGTASHVALRG